MKQRHGRAEELKQFYNDHTLAWDAHVANSSKFGSDVLVDACFNDDEVFLTEVGRVINFFELRLLKLINQVFNGQILITQCL